MRGLGTSNSKRLVEVYPSIDDDLGVTTNFFKCTHYNSISFPVHIYHADKTQKNKTAGRNILHARLRNALSDAHGADARSGAVALAT